MMHSVDSSWNNSGNIGLKLKFDMMGNWNSNFRFVHELRKIAEGFGVVVSWVVLLVVCNVENCNWSPSLVRVRVRVRSFKMLNTYNSIIDMSNTPSTRCSTSLWRFGNYPVLKGVFYIGFTAVISFFLILPLLRSGFVVAFQTRSFQLIWRTLQPSRVAI